MGWQIRVDIFTGESIDQTWRMGQPGGGDESRMINDGPGDIWEIFCLKM